TPGVYKVTGKKGKVKYRLYVNVKVDDPLSTTGFKWKLKGTTHDTYQNAVDAKVKTQSEVKSGKYVEATDATVKELFEAWLEAGKTRGVTKHGRWKIQTYFSHVAQLGHIAPKLGDIKASLLRKSQIEQAAAEWKEAISADTANTLIAQLSAAFKWALRDPDRFGVKANPVDVVERFAREERPEQIDEEFADYGEAQLRSKPGTLRKVEPHEVLSKLELRKLIEAAARARREPLSWWLCSAGYAMERSAGYVGRRSTSSGGPSRSIARSRGTPRNAAGCAWRRRREKRACVQSSCQRRSPPNSGSGNSSARPTRSISCL